MFTWLSQRKKPSSSGASRRPTAFRPELEAMEGRCLLSAGVTPVLPGLPGLAAKLGSSPITITYTETLHAHEVAWGKIDNNIYYATFVGTATGPKAGSFTATLLYSGTPGQGTNTILGGFWVGLPAHTKAMPPVGGPWFGTIAGGTASWNHAGTKADVSATVSAQGGFMLATAPGHLKGTFDDASGNFTGTLTFTAHG